MTQKGNVDECPATRDAWEERAKSGDCGGQRVYHCLADYEGRKWERCVEKSLVKEGFCPIFTYKGFIDWKPCNISTCPNIPYFSDDVYKFPSCFGTNSQHKQTRVNLNKAEGIPVAAFFGIVFGLFILAAILIFVLLYIRKKRFYSYSNECMESQNLLSERESNEIVKEQNVASGIYLLTKDEVRSILVVGKFGNSVSSTARSISKTFQEKMNWNSLECRYTDIPSSVDENTIMYIYGWFGLWNDELSSGDKAKTACQSLIRILNETRNVKIILGMRSDLSKKYHQELDEEVDAQNTSLVQYEINLDGGVDIRKELEYLRYLNDQIKKPCQRTDCACKRLKYAMLREGKDRVIGMPLKIRIIEKYHELIPTYLHHWDMLKVLIDHFTVIEKNRENRYLYEWIVYICLKGKFTRESFDKNLVKEIDFTIDKLSFDEKDSKLCKYIRMRNSDKQKNIPPENAQYVFWHPFIYICAFHFLFNKDPEFVIKHCNVDAILQLVRPKGFKTSYFEVIADKRCIALFNERIRLLGKEDVYTQHPLIQINVEELMELGVRFGLEMFKLFNTAANQSQEMRQTCECD